MDHLDSIVDNIVNFARNAEPRLSAVELPALIDDLALLTRHKLQHQGIQLLREDAPELPAIRADATQLSQAFLNLILNATEAMPQGGSLRIRTATVDEGMCSGAREEATCTHRDRQQWVDGVWRWCHTRSRTVSRRPGPSLTCAGAPRKRRGWRGWAAAALGLAVVAAAEPRHPPRARAKRRH